MILSAHNKMYGNDFSILNPIIWAQEAVARLLPQMVAARLVDRDFSAHVGRFGDVVNATVPAQFTMKKKSRVGQETEAQDAIVSKAQVRLNQWPYVTFVIQDGEEARPPQDLFRDLLNPAVQALALGIDQIILSNTHQFYPNVSGRLGQMSETTIQNYLIESDEVMNNNNVPMEDRVMIITPSTRSAGLKVDTFIEADKVGDDGSALRNASLGKKYGFNLFMAQQQPKVESTATTDTTTTGAAAAGATTIIVTSATGMAVGAWLTVAGDDTPQQIAGIASTTITIAPGLKRAIGSGAAVKTVKQGAVNFADGYTGRTSVNGDNFDSVPGSSEEILTDGFSSQTPKVGQFVTFGLTTTKYTITAVRTITAGTAFGLTLDRPLVASIANDATVNLGPAGQYNLGFDRRATTLVVRPLPQVKPGAGAISAVVNDPINQISLRVTIAYEPRSQGHRVTIDTLMGIGSYNNSRGVIMLG